MVRNAIIVGVVVLIVIGIGVFFGVRAIQERKVEKSEEAASTSTEAKAEGRGFFGFLRKDFVSKEPAERGEAGFQLNRWGSDAGSSDGSSQGSSDDGGGFVLRRDPSALKTSVSTPKVSSPKPSQIPFGFTKEQLSPFFGQVIINAIEYPRRSDYDRTSILLLAKGSANISGWKIKTNSGEVPIPRAIEKYIPGSSAESDVVLQSGQIFSLFGYYRFAEYQHPFGKNLRLNECTGYLNSVYAFSPKLPEKCPRIDKDELSPFSGACKTFLLNLGKCKVPTSEEINNFYGDSACQSFMRNTFGYGLCYSTHKDDENFLSNEWYAWLRPQAQIPLARDHDRILLFDTNGLLVDEFVY